MAKTKISEYSSTANSNTDIASINIDEGCAPSGINNAIRALMAQIHDLYAGTSGDTWPVAGGGTGSGTAAGARTNLGLAIGTDVQAYNEALAAIAANNGTNMMKNRIINGAMMIDQRNAGASVSNVNTGKVFSVDRFGIYGNQNSKFTAQQSTTAPVGFVNSLKLTSSSAYTVGSGETFTCSHVIEGNNIADLSWGTANAKTVTLSFQVYSSLTGTFGGAITNGAGDRSYPFSFSVSSANTWTSVSVTVAGDTSGTWTTDNSAGMAVYWSMGAGSTYSGSAGSWAGTLYVSATGATSVVGTSGATFYITGVQLEKGSTATSFDYRPYGTELALCQRYYEKSYDIGTAPGSNLGSQDSFGAADYLVMTAGNGSTGRGSGRIRFAVTKRAAPTFQYWDNAGNASAVTYFNSNSQYGSSNNTADGFRGGNTTATSLGFNYDTGSSTYPKTGILWAANSEL